MRWPVWMLKPYTERTAPPSCTCATVNPCRWLLVLSTAVWLNLTENDYKLAFSQAGSLGQSRLGRAY
uniref:Uncharacterized protein n=1 Tax=Anguilla anguilla TaxID=7936 RepID=A0A0E9XHM4_ANGAN